jgi:hypothetical protein
MVYHVGCRCADVASEVDLQFISSETARTIGDQAKAAIKLRDLDQHSISLLCGHGGKMSLSRHLRLKTRRLRLITFCEFDLCHCILRSSIVALRTGSW